MPLKSPIQCFYGPLAGCLRDRGIEQESAWLGACGRFDLNPKIASMVQNLQRQGAEQAHQPDETVHMVLQCEVRSSQELLL